MGNIVCKTFVILNQVSKLSAIREHGICANISIKTVHGVYVFSNDCYHRRLSTDFLVLHWDQHLYIVATHMSLFVHGPNVFSSKKCVEKSRHRLTCALL